MEKISRRDALKLIFAGGLGATAAVSGLLESSVKAKEETDFVGQGERGRFGGWKVESAGIGLVMGAEMKGLREVAGTAASDGVLKAVKRVLTQSGLNSGDYTIQSRAMALMGDKAIVNMPMVICQSTRSDRESIRLAVMGLSSDATAIRIPSVADMTTGDERHLQMIQLAKMSPLGGASTIKTMSPLATTFSVVGNSGWHFTQAPMFPDLATASMVPLRGNPSQDPFFRLA